MHFTRHTGQEGRKSWKKWAIKTEHILGFVLPSAFWEHALFSWENSSDREISHFIKKNVRKCAKMIVLGQY